MLEFGEQLKRARETAGLTLDDIYARTRINIKHLRAIEAGDFPSVPQTYVRAFIREYAELVGLDPDDTVHRYNELAEAAKGIPRPPEPIDNRNILPKPDDTIEILGPPAVPPKHVEIQGVPEIPDEGAFSPPVRKSTYVPSETRNSVLDTSAQAQASPPEAPRPAPPKPAAIPPVSPPPAATPPPATGSPVPSTPARTAGGRISLSEIRTPSPPPAAPPAKQPPAPAPPAKPPAAAAPPPAAPPVKPPAPAAPPPAAPPAKPPAAAAPQSPSPPAPAAVTAAAVVSPPAPPLAPPRRAASNTGRRAAITSLVVVILAVAAYVYYTFGPGSSSPEGMIDSTALKASIEAGRFIDSSTTAMFVEPVAPTDTGAALTPVEQTLEQAQRAAVREDSLILEAFSTASVWFSVKMDTVRSEKGTMSVNDHRVWKARDRFVVTLGDAGAITFYLNGRELGALGADGEVVKNLTITRQSGAGGN